MGVSVDRQVESWESTEIAVARLRGEVGPDVVEAQLWDVVDGWLAASARARVTGDEVAEPQALFCGRSQAALAHAALQTAYTLDADRAAGPITYGQVSSAYDSILDRARQEAMGESPEFDELLVEATDLVTGPATALARATGGLGRADRGEAMLGTRTTELLRRCAALLPALAYLGQRSVGGSSVSGLRRVAANRPVLRRSFNHQRFASRTVAGRSYGDRFAISGRVTDVGWVNRPQTPYSFARLHGAAFELRVHYRSMPAVGVAPGRWVWAHGKYEVSDGVTVMVAEFEGLGNHAATVWEDWLAAQTRAAYDLAPSSLDVSWEFPDPRYRCGQNDLRARIATSIGG